MLCGGEALRPPPASPTRRTFLLKPLSPCELIAQQSTTNTTTTLKQHVAVVVNYPEAARRRRRRRPSRTLVPRVRTGRLDSSSSSSSFLSPATVAKNTDHWRKKHHYWGTVAKNTGYRRKKHRST